MAASRDLDAVTALKLRCNKRSACTETPTPPLAEEETRTCLGENKNLGHVSHGDWSQE
jgi:hypothetical protein